MGFFDIDQEWLDRLKVGDEVCIEKSPAHGELEWTKATVEKVTPTRRIKVKAPDGTVTDFGTRGHIQTSDFGPTYKLVPWTQNIERAIERRKLERSTIFYLDLNQVDRKKVEALDDEQLYAIRALLRPLRKS